MKRYPVALTGQDDALTGFARDMREIDREFDERMTFLKKQEESIRTDIQGRVDDLWSKLRERVKDMGLLPKDFDPKTWEVTVSKDGVVYAEDHAECCGVTPRGQRRRHGKNDGPGGILIALSRLFD